MNKVLLGMVAVLGLGLSGMAQAGGALTGRVGLTGGSYKFDDKFVGLGCCSVPSGTVFTSNTSEGQYGALGGMGLVAGRFFADLGVEVDQYSKKRDSDFDGSLDTSIYRSDALLTLGAFIGDRWTVFAGYRHATFGDGVFSEKPNTIGNTENGPFLGGGVSFHPGKRLSLSSSAAYNFLKVSSDGTTFDEFDLNGFSLKLQMAFLGTPHAIFLRWQRFHGDVTYPNDHSYEYTEDYINLGYQATFDFTSW